MGLSSMIISVIMRVRKSDAKDNQNQRKMEWAGLEGTLKITQLKAQLGQGHLTPGQVPLRDFPTLSQYSLESLSK